MELFNPPPPLVVSVVTLCILVWWSSQLLGPHMWGCRFLIWLSSHQSALLAAGIPSHVTCMSAQIETPCTPSPIAQKGSCSMKISVFFDFPWIKIQAACYVPTLTIPYILCNPLFASSPLHLHYHWPCILVLTNIAVPCFLVWSLISMYVFDMFKYQLVLPIVY